MKELLRELECPCSGVFWLGWAGIHGRSCEATRENCRVFGFCGRSQSINHGSLGCSFSAFLHFPVWTSFNCWGAGSRAMDKQQEEAPFRQKLVRNKEPLVPAAHAETCSRMPWCGWQSSCGSPTVCVRGSLAPFFKAFLLCSFSSAHLQLRLSSLNCRIIVLQKYTVCFQDEARLVSVLRTGSSLFPYLAVPPALLPASSCSQELTAGEGGLSFSSVAPVGSVAADLGRDEPWLGVECIFPRVTWLSPVGQLQKSCMS